MTPSTTPSPVPNQGAGRPGAGPGRSTTVISHLRRWRHRHGAAGRRQIPRAGRLDHREQIVTPCNRLAVGKALAGRALTGALPLETSGLRHLPPVTLEGADLALDHRDGLGVTDIQAEGL